MAATTWHRIADEVTPCTADYVCLLRGDQAACCTILSPVCAGSGHGRHMSNDHLSLCLWQTLIFFFLSHGVTWGLLMGPSVMRWSNEPQCQALAAMLCPSVIPGVPLQCRT